MVERSRCHPAVSLGLLAASLSACASRSAPSDAGPHADATARADVVVDARPEAPVSTARTCTLTRPSPPDWRLVTDGPAFKDGLGRVVFLRGVNAGGRSKIAPYVPFDFAPGGFDAALDAYMKRAATWGIDVMRVPFTWAALEPTRTTPPTYDAAWLAEYEKVLAAAWSYGIYTIVDFHQDVYSEVFCGDGFPGWTVPDAGPPMTDCPQWGAEYLTDPSVRGAFDAFWPDGSPARVGYAAAWDAMIAAVASTPGVIGLEPINEPAAGTADLATFEATTLTSFFSAVATEMNAKAPAALLFIDGTELDGVQETTSLQKPGGSNLVFAPHFYPVGDLASSQVLDGLGQWAAYGTMWNLPVFVGEFGGPYTSPFAPSFLGWVYDGFDALGLSGSQWEYSVSTVTWNEEMDSIVDGTGAERPTALPLIRPFARAVAGSGVTQALDGTTGTYTVSYTASGGITELSVPSRAFPSGVGIDAVGACVDATGVAGEVLVSAPAGTAVTVTLRGGAHGG